MRELLVWNTSYREAATFDTDTTFLMNKGLALYRAGKWDMAAAGFREVIRLDPNNVQAHYNLTLALKAKKDYGGVGRGLSEPHQI